MSGKQQSGAVVVLGAQWGDEGKGKLVDILCGRMKLVARAAGGNNAGHTIVVNGITYDFHLLPSGLINPECQNLLGSGMVVSVSGLFKELGLIEAKGLKGAADRVYISDRAQIALDLHAAVDGLEEAELAGTGKKIGTTGKGIGPSYSTKHARSGVRIGDIFDKALFDKKLRTLYESYKKRYGPLLDGYDVEDEITRFDAYRPKLAPMVVDAVAFMVDAQKSQWPILIEGANAIMLDIDYGTYPYVTSSSTGLGGVLTGLGGLNPTSIKTIYGVLKAYTTRVGGGPFPTEDLGAVGTTLQEKGREFGVTTGRKRRCGWLDLVVAKYSAQLNHYTHINVTKLDILDEFKTIKVATGYKDPATGELLPSFPADLAVLGGVEVVYEELPGWNTPTTHAKSFDELPKEARDYVLYIEKFLGIPVSHIGTGPKREDMIVR